MTGNEKNPPSADSAIAANLIAHTQQMVDIVPNRLDAAYWPGYPPVTQVHRSTHRYSRTRRQRRTLGVSAEKNNRENPESKDISWQRPFGTYFLLIVRSRNSRINDPIRSTSSSNAKWPVSRRWSSALGISPLISSAPSTVKIPSFLPHVISVGG